jgi:2-hydroxychromene-2-carboxylate isomerase
LVDLFSETGGLPLVKRRPVRQRYRMVELQRWRDKRGSNFYL